MADNFDNYNMKVQAKAVMPSVKDIDAQIRKLEKSISKLKVSGQFDATALKNLTNQLNALKANVTTAHFSPTALNELTSQVNKALENINIGKINVGNTSSGVKKAGQQIGKLISDSAEQAIGKVSSRSMGRYFKIDPSTSNQFRAEMEKLVSDWTNKKGKLTDIKIDTRTSYDKESEANITRLHQATVTYKNELDEVIKKTIAWRQIGTTTNANGEEEILRGFVEVAGQYSKSLDAVNTKSDTFIDKQKQAVATAKNSLSTIESKLNDKGANKTLANTDFDANGLNQQLDKVRNAIVALENANKNTFTQAKIDVDTEITSLNNLITTLRNAEYAATSLRTKDISTVKIDEGNNLNAFVQKMEQSGHYTDELKQKVANLKSQLNGVFDANTLTSYLNGLSNLQSEFKAVDATAKTFEKSVKLEKNVESEKKQLQVYTNELKEAGVLTGEVKQKIQDMFYSLSKVDSQNGLITWRAELKGVKAETDAVLKSVTQLSSKKLDEIQFAIDTEKYSTQIFKLQEQLKRFGSESGEAFTNAEKSVEQMKTAYNGMKTSSGDDRLKYEKEYQKALTTTNNLLSQIKSVKANELIGSGDYRRSNFVAELNNYLLKNTAMTEQSRQKILQWIATLESADDITRGTFDNIKKDFKSLDVQLRQTGQLGLSSMDKLKQAWEKFGGWSMATGTLMTGWSKVKESVSELKEINTILTEISKTSDRTAESLKQLGDDSFEVASDYGRKASDYLTSVQEMNRSGFYDEQGNAMAELTVLTQAAGDVSKETAIKYLLASNAAYKYNANIEKLTAMLDGQNYITNKHSVDMETMASATEKAGSVAANAGVKIDQLSAMIGTISARTKEAGEITGTGLKSLIINLQNISSKKITGTLDKANASMTETVNGVEQLRDPIAILKDLAKTYNSLDAKDPLKAEITTNIGQKYHANQLAALLTGWSDYEKMLQDYSEGSGSAMAEAQKSSENWEGTLNKVNNSITDIVGNIVDSDTVISGLKGFNNLLESINQVTSSGEKLITVLGTIGLTILNQKKSGGLMELIPIINNSPFLATVEFNSDVYDSYACA